jgi:hypothetical protein
LVGKPEGKTPFGTHGGQHKKWIMENKVGDSEIVDYSIFIWLRIGTGSELL